MSSGEPNARRHRSDDTRYHYDDSLAAIASQDSPTGQSWFLDVIHCSKRPWRLKMSLLPEHRGVAV